MECSNCLKDFKEDEKEKGFYTQQNPHFGRPFRQFGYVCPHCGYHNTVFHIPTRVPFLRTGRTYDKLDAIIERFQKEVENFYKERNKNKLQHTLFGESDEQRQS